MYVYSGLFFSFQSSSTPRTNNDEHLLSLISVQAVLQMGGHPQEILDAFKQLLRERCQPAYTIKAADILTRLDGRSYPASTMPGGDASRYDPVSVGNFHDDDTAQLVPSAAPHSAAASSDRAESNAVAEPPDAEESLDEVDHPSDINVHRGPEWGD
ncbi:hypothetical protein BaRGS_00017553 [Batillaria attramentaria]|uniref:Uncharacterized protein n=1 Tax=Batillaria attramentaria TaxID=370345 RepID=A0ABD0KVN3_9CAEN